MPSTNNSANSQPKKPWYRSATFLKLLLVLLIIFVGWTIYLDAQVRYKFEGKRWALPAKVYARALEIYDGRALNVDNLKRELALLNYQQVSAADRPGTYTSIETNDGHAITIFVRAHNLPQGAQASEKYAFWIINDVVARLQSPSDNQLFTIEPYKMGGIYAHSKEERILLSFEDVPKELVQALVVTEDRDFFSHFGISPFGIMRAMLANISAGRVVQGGSTLTQQLVKNFYLSRERSLWRKANEAIMSVLLEAHYEKEDILETYINDIFLGQAGSAAIHGFGMASQFYFDKSLEQCELHELALLVAILKGPSYYNPHRSPDRTLTRRNLVLKLMFEADLIDEQRFTETLNLPLDVVKKPSLQTNRYPAFMDLVKRQLQDEYHEEDLRTEGLNIYTTLDPQLQHAVEHSIEDFMSRSSRMNEIQSAAMITGVGTGEVLAITGDKNPRYRGFNRALDAQRQIGSLIKPVVFLSALMQPEKYHLASILSDQGFKIEFTNGQVWQPQNFDGKDHGDQALFNALAKSYNIPTARLGLELGVDSVIETIRKLGINKEITPYPALFLGAQSMSPYEISQLYQTIASNGFNVPLRAIREVTTSNGETLSRYFVEIEQKIPDEAIYLLHYAMQETMRTGTGRSAYRVLPEALNTAGKTGTTNDNRDSWFAGFSGDYLGVVWLGKDDNSPTHLTGGSGALQVWSRFIGKVPQYPLSNVQPDAVSYYWFDKETWEHTDPKCNNAMPLPVWGEPKSVYRACEKGFSSIKGWIQSWF